MAVEQGFTNIAGMNREESKERGNIVGRQEFGPGKVLDVPWIAESGCFAPEGQANRCMNAQGA